MTQEGREIFCMVEWNLKISKYDRFLTTFEMTLIIGYCGGDEAGILNIRLS
jgi:hypothetical protein